VQKNAEPQINRPPKVSGEGAVLVVAPSGQDAFLGAAALKGAAISTKICRNLDDLAGSFGEETQALLIAEEALAARQLPALLKRLREQPPWSDIPVIILSAPGAGDRNSGHALEIFGPAANVSLLERPLRAVTLVAAVKAALRARRRQWEVRDLIIQRESALEAVNQAKIQAEEASRAKDQFLAVLSHELRTPLTPVLMMISSLQTDPRLSAEIKEDLGILRRNVELEALLIDDLLDLTRITHGKLQLNPQAIDVHTSIEHALAISAAELEQKQIRVSRDFAAQYHRASADSARLEQVFWNIIKNAVKFTPAGGELRISTVNLENDSDLVIDFTDSGIGVAPELVPHIFDAFQQGGHGVTSRFGGLGLGLAICKRVIELHGGEISVHSEGLNRGATFRIVLKTNKTQVINEPAETKPPARRRDAVTILLVEDHADTARILGRSLGLSGYRVDHAPDCASARELAERNAFDLVISDLGLPDGDGLELMRDLRSAHGLEGIALSGFGMETDIAAAKAAGFLEHLTKPINLDSLNAAIERLLHREIKKTTGS
jgi:signal transduction histidine kinase/ActR/RegA family two-component response regulator